MFLIVGLQRYTEFSVYLPNTGLLITDRIPTDFLTFYRIPTSSKYLTSVSNYGSVFNNRSVLPLFGIQNRRLFNNFSFGITDQRCFKVGILVITDQR